MISSINIIAEIHTPDIPPVVVQPLALDLQCTDYVVNIYDPGYFSATNRDVYLNNLSKRFYQRFGDVYDMLNFVTAADYIENRHHIAFKNTVQGIGQTIFDHTAMTGSSGHLLGFNVFPSTSFIDGADVGYVHEFGHQWIQYMQLAPFSSGIPHWPISSLAFGVMGVSIPPNGVGGNYNCKLVSETGRRAVAPRQQSENLYRLRSVYDGLVGG